MDSQHHSGWSKYLKTINHKLCVFESIKEISIQVKSRIFLKIHSRLIFILSQLMLSSSRKCWKLGWVSATNHFTSDVNNLLFYIGYISTILLWSNKSKNVRAKKPNKSLPVTLFYQKYDVHVTPPNIVYYCLQKLAKIWIWAMTSYQTEHADDSILYLEMM